MRHPSEFTNRLRFGKLIVNRWKSRQNSLPGWFPLRKPQVLREFIANGNTRAGDTVVEPQHPHPSAIENVVQGCVVYRVGRVSSGAVSRHCIATVHAREMGKQRLSCRITVEAVLRDTQLS